jgi:hypothetical protein
VTEDNQPLKASASASETPAPARAADSIFDNKMAAFDDNADSIAAQHQKTIVRPRPVKLGGVLNEDDL